MTCSYCGVDLHRPAVAFPYVVQCGDHLAVAVPDGQVISIEDGAAMAAAWLAAQKRKGGG